MNKDSTLKLLSGNEIPVMGMGTWQLENTADIVSYALELGYPMIDTASDYNTQPGINEGIKKSNINRSDLYISTKVEEKDDAYERTKSNLEELGVDYIDLEIIHRPPPSGAGEELWEGLIKAKSEGLVKDIGVSNYSSELIDRLIESSNEVPVVDQIEWSPYGHSDDHLEYCRSKGIIIQAYSPLTRAKKLDDEDCVECARRYGRSPAQILIRWNLQRGTVPLPKANKREHLEQNLDVFDFELSDEDMEKLNSLNEHYSSLGKLPYI